MTENLLPDAGERALEALEAWMSGRDDELIAEFDDTMRAQLPPDKLAQTWPQLTGLVGAYESCGDPILRPFGDQVGLLSETSGVRVICATSPFCGETM